MRNKFVIILISILLSSCLSNRQRLFLYNETQKKNLFSLLALKEHKWEEINDSDGDNRKRVRSYNQGGFDNDSLSSDLVLSKKLKIILRSKWGAAPRQDSIFILERWFNINHLLGYSDSDSSLFTGIDVNASISYYMINQYKFVTILSETPFLLGAQGLVNSFVFDITDTNNIEAFAFENVVLEELGDFDCDGVIDAALINNKDSSIKKIIIYNYNNRKFVKNENYFLRIEYDSAKNYEYINKEKSKWFFLLK